MKCKHMTEGEKYILHEETRAAEVVRGCEKGWTSNTRTVQSFGGMNETLSL